MAAVGCDEDDPRSGVELEAPALAYAIIQALYALVVVVAIVGLGEGIVGLQALKLTDAAL
jgi:hypothetical protein